MHSHTRCVTLGGERTHVVRAGAANAALGMQMEEPTFRAAHHLGPRDTMEASEAGSVRTVEDLVEIATRHRPTCRRAPHLRGPGALSRMRITLDFIRHSSLQPWRSV